ncbi:helix-turn-helix domain-containing protein [Lactiplantibacillus herbarum]|uniref:helix-turn-helix domain-containing protein n=1 Tax=Lactiplantibacillus herbarum TaxID=1670446 RepID=UPI00069D49A4|nr:helix-turn-helix transcriptional regulator [Lactiplantibacillus herbarum]
MSVFDNIKKYSKQRGLNLQSVALKSGLSKNVIYQYNKGKNPSLETLGKIASVLGTTTDMLLDDKEKQPSDAPKHIDVAEIVDSSAMLTSRDHALSDEDQAAIKTLITTYLNSKEGQDRLRQYGGYGDDGKKINEKRSD